MSISKCPPVVQDNVPILSAPIVCVPAIAPIGTTALEPCVKVLSSLKTRLSIY